MSISQYFIGVDLGQVLDFTAIAVVERAELTGKWDPVMLAYRKVVELRIRHLERAELGTPYPDVVARVREVARAVGRSGRCQVVVDGTGVGRPVVDLLRRAGLGCGLVAATITSGDRESVDGGGYRVPKRDLIVGLQVLLQQGALQMAARLKDGPALMKEMAEMRVKVTAVGREVYGVWREGEHDDLILAVALACWGARKMYPNPPAGEEAWWRRVPDPTVG